MNIVILQDYLRGGGTETQTVFIADFLRRHSIHCQIVTCRPGGALAGRAHELDIPTTALQKKDLHLDFYAPKLIHTLRQIRPNIILLMGKVANSYGCWIRKKLPNVQIISTLRTGKPVNFLYRRILKDADRVIVNSQYAWQRVTEEYGQSPSRTHIIRNSLARRLPEDRAELRQKIRQQMGLTDRDILLITVAMFRPEKNHMIIPPMVQSTDWPAHVKWALVGDGEIREQLQKQCPSPVLLFEGWQSDPVPYLCAADIAVLPSLRESLPNFLVEAQSFGLPVISFDIGGNRECFQDGISGLLARDAADMKQAILRLTQDSNLRSNMSVAAEAYALREFSTEQQGEHYLRILNELTQ
jgi:glycosyltransferase involved in cell wall biosynthesis